MSAIPVKHTRSSVENKAWCQGGNLAFVKLTSPPLYKITNIHPIAKRTDLKNQLNTPQGLSLEHPDHHTRLVFVPLQSMLFHSNIILEIYDNLNHFWFTRHHDN